jgi:hypothetical protein
MVHGAVVALLSLVLAAIVGGVVGAVSDQQDVKDNLRSIGVPTTGDQVTDVAIVAVAVSLAAIFLGAIVGGMLGERWHTKLARRAADPDVGPAAEARARAAQEDAERDRRLNQDETVRRETLPATTPGEASDDERLTYAEWRAREQELQRTGWGADSRPR